MTDTAYRPSGDRHHVVVIGAGLGGLNAVKKLKDANVDVTVIDKKNHHLFQPMLYQVTTGLISASDISPSIRQLLAGQDNAHFINGEVTDIDVDKQTVTANLAGTERVVEYDSLVVAAGSNQSYFGNDHFAEFAPGMKSLDDALEIRSTILTAFEKAELTDDPAERERLLTFIIVGAGPTGVELAGQVAELAHRTLTDKYSHIQPEAATIYLLDGAPQVLPPFGKRLGRKTQRTLEKSGVTVRLNAMVSNVDENSVTYKTKDGDEVTIEGFTKIWSAGVAASPLGKLIADQIEGVEADRGGRVAVNKDLTVGDKDNLYIIGDMINLDKLPGLAQVAMQGGEHVAKLIDAKIDEESTADEKEAFDYFDKGTMAIINRGNAVAKIGRTELHGVIPWLMWLGVHGVYLSGIRNRTFAVAEWIFNVFTAHRGNLEITQQQRVSRRALDYDKK